MPPCAYIHAWLNIETRPARQLDNASSQSTVGAAATNKRVIADQQLACINRRLCFRARRAPVISLDYTTSTSSLIRQPILAQIDRQAVVLTRGPSLYVT
jgi:hypothetical protein